MSGDGGDGGGGDARLRAAERGAYAQAAAAGGLLWLAAALLSGRREPWDGAAYWLLVYPLALAACAWLGWRHPRRPWRWALALFLAQFAAMVLLQGALGNLWPLGLALFCILSLPGMLLARLAAGRRGRSSS